ncbi:MAG: ATP-binding protein [Gemmatimonadales bacterium]
MTSDITRGHRPKGILTALYAIPLFYKIVIANVAIVAVCTIFGTVFAAEFRRTWPGTSMAPFIAAFAVVGVAVSAIVNTVLVRLALSPLNALVEAAERVYGGDMEARASISQLADRDLRQLIDVFNRMLDSLEEYRRRLRSVAHGATKAQEMERQRLSRELHDDTSQRLAALVLQLRLARDAPDEETRNARFDDLREEMVDIAEAVRRFAYGLRPQALDQLGPVAAIAEYARLLSEGSGQQIDLKADQISGLLSADGELVLYRIVQEAISNAVRHSGADNIKVRIERCDTEVVGTVTDNGCGFIEDGILARGSTCLGIFGMRERASYVAGQLSIQSEPQNGTTIQVRIPHESDYDGD